MKTLLHLFLIYALVVGVAVCLSSLSWPWRVELSEIAGQSLSRFLNADEFAATRFISDMGNPRYVRLQVSLYWLQAAFIVLMFVLLAVFSRPASTAKSTVDQLAAVLAGIGTGKLLMGFPFFDWTVVLLWSLAGISVFAVSRSAKFYVSDVRSTATARSARRRP